MNVVSLEEARQARLDQQAVIKADAERLVAASTEYGRLLADAAHYAMTLVTPAGDDYARVVERFTLRRGLARSRRAWCKEYGRDAGSQFAKMAAPIVRRAFAEKLDELHPLTVQRGNVIIPVVRGAV